MAMLPRVRRRDGPFRDRLHALRARPLPRGLRATCATTPSSSPHASWNWCWLGKAASAIGERAEAEQAYRRALELTAEGDDETDAAELLAALEAHGDG